MRSILWLTLALFVLSGHVALAAVSSIVIGASGSGTIDGLYLGNYQTSGTPNLYGFGAPSVDKDALISDYEEIYPDQFFSDPAPPPPASVSLGLDMSVDNALKITASSKLLDTSSIASLRNDHAGLVQFSISKDASVVANFTGSVSVILTIRDNFSNVLWTSGDGTAPFSMTSGAYKANYSLAAEFGSGTTLLSELFELNLVFTPAADPDPPPTPNPPPGPETVPEPTSLMAWAAGLGLMRWRFGRKRPTAPSRLG
jgi:hypothetical protein